MLAYVCACIITILSVVGGLISPSAFDYNHGEASSGKNHHGRQDGDFDHEIDHGG